MCIFTRMSPDAGACWDSLCSPKKNASSNLLRCFTMFSAKVFGELTSLTSVSISSFKATFFFPCLNFWHNFIDWISRKMLFHKFLSLRNELQCHFFLSACLRTFDKALLIGSRQMLFKGPSKTKGGGDREGHCPSLCILVGIQAKPTLSSRFADHPTVLIYKILHFFLYVTNSFLSFLSSHIFCTQT